MKKNYMAPKARKINIDGQLLQVGSPGDVIVGPDGTIGNYAKRRHDDFIYFLNEEEDEYDDEYYY